MWICLLKIAFEGFSMASSPVCHLNGKLKLHLWHCITFQSRDYTHKHDLFSYIATSMSSHFSTFLSSFMCTHMQDSVLVVPL